jgi:hypothetical protein
VFEEFDHTVEIRRVVSETEPLPKGDAEISQHRRPLEMAGKSAIERLLIQLDRTVQIVRGPVAQAEPATGRMPNRRRAATPEPSKTQTALPIGLPNDRGDAHPLYRE